MSSSGAREDTGLPPNWEIRHSNSKNLPYYFNFVDKSSRWEPPPGTNTEALKVYMAKYHSGQQQQQQQAPQQQQQQQAGGGGGGGGGHQQLEQQMQSAGKIRAAHLLVKHRDSRRPASWREATVTRSKEEARAILGQHEERIRRGETTLGDLALTESDCSSSRKRGDLGYFGPGDMQREFEEAAFSLKPGGMSGIVETASGLHLIERLA